MNFVLAISEGTSTVGHDKAAQVILTPKFKVAVSAYFCPHGKSYIGIRMVPVKNWIGPRKITQIEAIITNA